MRLLILGKDGQVGSELVELCAINKIEVIATNRQLLDLGDVKAIAGFFSLGHQFDFVINAAAYTAVDKAESEADIARQINHVAVEVIARQCKKYAIPLIHISTDYVFDGSKKSMYIEDDVTAPLGVYGESKRDGENAVKATLSNYIILRVSWVFGKNGNNFVKTMARMATLKEEIGVVSDQYGSPTSAKHIAEVILEIIKHNSGGNPAWGIYHYTDFPLTTWHQLAIASISEAKKQGLDIKLSSINAIETKDYPTPVKRPTNSAMSAQKLQNTFGINQKRWSVAIPQVISQFKEEMN